MDYQSGMGPLSLRGGTGPGELPISCGRGFGGCQPWRLEKRAEVIEGTGSESGDRWQLCDKRMDDQRGLWLGEC